YGYITYVTSYLKANYPAYWMAALMTSDRNDVDRITQLIQECKNMQLEILPPDINQATESFSAEKHGIRFGLNGIKGVGGGIVRALCEELHQNGPFQDLFDFVFRLLPVKISKRTVECFIESGACDGLHDSRLQMKEQLNDLFACAVQKRSEEERGIQSFFDQRFVFQPMSKAINIVDKEKMLLKEKGLLGFALTGDPLSLYEDVFADNQIIRLSEFIKKNEKTPSSVSFIIESVKIKSSKASGQQFGVLVVSDGMYRTEVTVWNNVYSRYADSLQENAIYIGVLLVEGRQISCLGLHPLVLGDSRQINELKTIIEDQKTLAIKQMNRSSGKKISKGDQPIESCKRIRITIDAKKATAFGCFKLSESLKSTRGEYRIDICFTGHSKKKCLVNLNKSYLAQSAKDISERLEWCDFVSVELLDTDAAF
ncbi:hypothetical protein, partial [Candidatus Similichlamydia epinepheli]|uniref:helix-hairpin-helix domain-containing protein n=1 Tax=Candidatus Similichlamydia epinepheli TaxID=1903953 RepID=UPI001300828A